MTLRAERIRTPEQVRSFVEGNDADFRIEERREAYDFASRTLSRFGFHSGLDRAGKGLVRAYLMKITGLSRAQTARLIAQHGRAGRIRDGRLKPPARAFARRYANRDRALPAKVDERLGRLSGPATKEFLRREWEVRGDARFERLARISSSHIYNLRNERSRRARFTPAGKAGSKAVSVGQRRKPRPEGRPGFLRVDTAHLGERDGEKGIHIINAVDEVTQFQHLGAAPAITHAFMVPLLRAMISDFPFAVPSFHADNGSEFVNHPQDRVRTPCEHLKSIDGAERFLKPGASFEELDRRAAEATGLEAARTVSRELRALFRTAREAGGNVA